jgi:D-alanyl-D-alanine carboxypeptidase
MSESTSRPRHRSFSFAAVIVITLVVSRPFVKAQNATVGSTRVSANKKTGASRPDVQRFQARVDAALADSRASRAFWGILIADRDTGEILYELNADKFFTPASNAKIFTSALVLSTLPRDFRFHTTLETTGQLGADGRLVGDLILVGHGDPDFSNRKFPYAGKVEREGATDAPLVEMVNKRLPRGLERLTEILSLTIAISPTIRIQRAGAWAIYFSHLVRQSALSRSTIIPFQLR